MLIIRSDVFRKIVCLIIFSLFLTISWRAFQSHLFNIHFVDEDENIVAGHYMNKGEKLYGDIFSHKQPLLAVFSMVTQKIADPPNLYLLIKRHREVVFFYSVLWSMILIWEFGLAGLAFSIAFEITKQFLLGNLFLGESLAVFPAVYLLGFLWKNHQDLNKSPSLEKFLFSFSLILLLLFLFALVPFVVFIMLTMILLKKGKTYLLFLGLSVVIGLLLTVFFVDYQKYFENTLVAIQTQYWGSTANEGFVKIVFYSFFRPLAILSAVKKGDFSVFLTGLSLIYLISLFLLFVSKKNLRKLLIISFFLLGVSSLRLVEPLAAFYDGFHALPWFALILWLTILHLKDALKDTKRTSLLILTGPGLILASGALLFLGRFMVADYYRVVDKERDWYVNFSRFQNYGQIIKTLAKPEETVIVLPVEQLIYWESGLRHATRFLYGYEWLFVNPRLKQEIKEALEKEKPTFIYYDRTSMGKDAWSIFDKYVDDYVRLQRRDQTIPLFVRKK